MFSNYLLLFLLTIIFLEIFFILIQTVKNKFSCHVLSENAVLIAPNFASYCGVRCASAARPFASAESAWLDGIVVSFYRIKPKSSCSFVIYFSSLNSIEIPMNNKTRTKIYSPKKVFPSVCSN